jgi:hypothetical protein
MVASILLRHASSLRSARAVCLLLAISGEHGGNLPLCVQVYRHNSWLYISTVMYTSTRDVAIHLIHAAVVACLLVPDCVVAVVCLQLPSWRL